ncbi:hypothetical protein PYW08_003329 [Mythimna loreyi]|uniref:Uncharacterized protein n=1 Tax=Mythimna loreyi TaxID=667449 RepID=A0ACC2QRY9_9NEOP|nr:hypothetical protein PYW08_003329 [Mythimna loreyi]
MSTSLRIITTLTLVLNLLFQSSTCGDLRYLSVNATRRVRGGIPVNLGELPYQIAFKARHDKDPKRFYTFCGGAIIGKIKILSAVHCFVGETTRFCQRHHKYVRSLQDKYAVAGTIKNVVYFEEEEYEQWRAIRSVTYPKNYKFPDNDLAVVIVTDPFKFNDFVKPIKIDEIHRDYDGISLVSGYGEISNTIGSDRLLKANLVLFPYDYCSKLNPRKEMAKLICTSLIGADIGRGDSGGPLIYAQHVSDMRKNDRRILIGIASGTIGDRNSVFIRLSSYQGGLVGVKNAVCRGLVRKPDHADRWNTRYR